MRGSAGSWTRPRTPPGRLDLGFETLRLPDDPDQALVAHTVEEGSPSQTALRLLAAWKAETRC
ncbi:MmyB family transcriptional regulator [Actinomadura sediminis]|uniref:MmyB-like transcription regulator ligand binding domain-containing protein n=1 Tax=Actinomadura sediminis TaxID=1038904 RepID=A0ABW3EL86_9ACTN